MSATPETINALHSEGVSYAEIGARFGESKDAVRGRHVRWMGRAGAGPLSPADALPGRSDGLPRRAGVSQAPVPPLPEGPDRRGDYVGFDFLFWDLETTDLRANIGRLLCASSVDQFGRLTTFRADRYQTRSRIDDSRLAVAIRDHLETADVWVTWNGKRFDVGFLNARLMKAGERPLRKDIKHIDLMYFAGESFTRIGSRRLDNVAKFFALPEQKTPLDTDIWANASAGDIPSLDRVVEHCEADVYVTRSAFARLKPHVMNVHR